MADSGVKLTVRDDMKPRMWVGDLHALGNLVKACRDLEAAEHERLTGMHKSTESDRRKEWARWKGPMKEGIDEAWAGEDASQLAKTLEKSSLKMELKTKGYNQQLEGSPEQVIDEIARPQDVISLQMSLGSSYSLYSSPDGYGFRLTMDKDGAGVNIFGQTTDWIDRVKGKFTYVLTQQRPKFSWIRNYVVTSLLAIIPPVAFYVWAASQPGLNATAKTNIFLFFLVVVTASTFFVHFFLAPRLFPSFELVPLGRRSLGIRSGGAIVGAIVWVVGSIVLPLLIR